jgi:hypothetical protein
MSAFCLCNTSTVWPLFKAKSHLFSLSLADSRSFKKKKKKNFRWLNPNSSFFSLNIFSPSVKLVPYAIKLFSGGAELRLSGALSTSKGRGGSSTVNTFIYFLID